MSEVREYEAILVLKDVNTQAQEKFVDSIQKIFSKRNISVKSQESWGIRKLFHPVVKEEKGEFQHFLFKATGEDISALQSDLKLDLNILKCFITRV